MFSKPLFFKTNNIKIELSGNTTIGRNTQNDIVIDDKSVSRNHAIIEKKDTKYYILDLNSKMGISVNGHLITDDWEIKKGDIVKIGTAKCFIVQSNISVIISIILGLLLLVLIGYSYTYKTNIDNSIPSIKNLIENENYKEALTQLKLNKELYHELIDSVEYLKWKTDCVLKIDNINLLNADQSFYNNNLLNVDTYRLKYGESTTLDYIEKSITYWKNETELENEFTSAMVDQEYIKAENITSKMQEEDHRQNCLLILYKKIASNYLVNREYKKAKEYYNKSLLINKNDIECVAQLRLIKEQLNNKPKSKQTNVIIEDVIIYENSIRKLEIIDLNPQIFYQNINKNDLLLKWSTHHGEITKNTGHNAKYIFSKDLIVHEIDTVVLQIINTKNNRVLDSYSIYLKLVPNDGPFYLYNSSNVIHSDSIKFAEIIYDEAREYEEDIGNLEEAVKRYMKVLGIVKYDESLNVTRETISKLRMIQENTDIMKYTENN